MVRRLTATGSHPLGTSCSLTAVRSYSVAGDANHGRGLLSGRQRNAPALSLLTPGGVEITPNNRPANVGYQQVTTYTFGIRPQAPQAGVTGLSPETVQALSATMSEQSSAGSLCQFKSAASSIIANDEKIQAALANGTADPALVRFTNALPDAAVVDCWQTATQSYRCGLRQTTGYADITPGVYTIQVVPAGATAPVWSVNADGNHRRRLLAGKEPDGRRTRRC